MLKEGNIIKLKAGHRVYADVPEHFVYVNKRGCFDLTHSVIAIGGELDYFEGEYVVYNTTRDGGGSGHSNGYHVFCEKLEDPDVKVDFYQTGAFTATIKDIKVIRNATRRWVDK